MALFVAFVGNVDVRDIFLNISPAMIELLSFDRALIPGIGLLAAWCVVLGGLGGAMQLISTGLRRLLVVMGLAIVVGGVLESVVVQLFRGLGFASVGSSLYQPLGGLTYVGAAIVGILAGVVALVLRRRRRRLRDVITALPPARRRTTLLVISAATLLLLGALPSILGSFLTEVLNIAGIFMLMALGLNIVLGYAGLLDLGYVAFFAVGAYSTAVLTSPLSPGFSPTLIFWSALPFVVAFGVIAGLLVATPVLRMRGDYVAIVTLGFGEIARLLFLSDWLRPYFGGAQGIIRIPNITIGPIELDGPQLFFYMIFGLALISSYISLSLQNSRMGRAWIAMREDETVADAMGINTVASKIWAFAIGAVLASVAGGLFATKIHSVVPASFGIEQSILVLIIVIIGGIGSVPGVVVGAVALVTVPELLREFEEFRFLVYGALLIFMMLRRPEGLIPSRRRAAELHEAERSQDDWLRAAVAEDAEPE
jgi:branched-chain amino acid transport system permease protein